ncbi:MAG: hypothetical protein NTV93_00020 [Verrucomicrobia bacterium]|nr:hypothetical protein [Verrucomicrobiota bacterium]
MNHNSQLAVFLTSILVIGAVLCLEAQVVYNEQGGARIKNEFTSVHQFEEVILKVGKSARPTGSQNTITLLKVDGSAGKALFRVFDSIQKKVSEGWVKKGKTFERFSGFGKSGVILKKVDADSVVLIFNYPQ